LEAQKEARDVQLHNQEREAKEVREEGREKEKGVVVEDTKEKKENYIFKQCLSKVRMTGVLFMTCNCINFVCPFIAILLNAFLNKFFT
jgi:hypothetical protein